MVTLRAAFLAISSFSLLFANAGVFAEDCNENSIDDALEISGAPHKDSNKDGMLDYCQGFSVDKDAISVSAGGTQNMTLNLGPGMAGQIYWIFGGVSGSTPGFNLGFTHVPINWDAYTALCFKAKNAYISPSQGIGALFADGTAKVKASLAAGSDPNFIGLEVRHAYVILFNGGSNGLVPVWASNPVVLTLKP